MKQRPGYHSQGMNLSTSQLEAILEAKAILEKAGLSPTAVLTPETSVNTPHHSSSSPYKLSSLDSPSRTYCTASLLVQASRYDAPLAIPFSEEECRDECNRINRKTQLVALVEHPLGAIVEYPQTGSKAKESVGHRFTIDPDNFVHPKGSFQYSLGDNHGGRSNVFCKLLVDDRGQLVSCKNLQTSCELLTEFIAKFSSHLAFSNLGKSLKICSSCPDGTLESHSFTSRSRIILSALDDSSSSAQEEVFSKTLALYSTLLERGCSFNAELEHQLSPEPLLDFSDSDSGSEDLSDSDSDEPLVDEDRLYDPQSRRPSQEHACRGRILLVRDKYQRPIIQ